jgi:hypothetical protein
VFRKRRFGHFSAMRTKRISTTAARNAIAIASLGAIVTATAAPAAAAPNPAQSPELQALEQRMSELTVTSERFSGSISFGGKLPRKAAALRDLEITVSGEQSLTPPVARVTTTVAGKSSTLMQIGNVLYIREPALARHDGGRPWVKLDESARDKLFGSNPGLGSSTGLGGSSGATAPQSFESDAELLERSADVRALGPSTVEAQAVSGFAGTLDASKAAGGLLPKKLIGELHRKHVKISASFQMFVSATGVPVSTTLTLKLGKLKLTAVDNVVAINFPVSANVPPPPGGETITAAELERLERKARAKHKKK